MRRTPGRQTMVQWTRSARVRKNAIVVIVFLAFYNSAYYWLSRCGYAKADLYGFSGFYYFMPQNTDGWWRRNYACVLFFYPANTIDRMIGWGRAPASPPLWGLSR